MGSSKQRQLADDYRASTAETQGAMRACWALNAGMHGPQQPAYVRRVLTVLEQRELAVYDERRGWRLTAAGNVAARTYLAFAKEVVP